MPIFRTNKWTSWDVADPRSDSAASSCYAALTLRGKKKGPAYEKSGSPESDHLPFISHPHPRVVSKGPSPAHAGTVGVHRGLRRAGQSANSSHIISSQGNES